MSIERGSGGACGVYYSSYGNGGNGGGSIKLNAVTIVIDGTISANGANGTTGSAQHGSGGGSGGGILVNGTLVTIKGIIMSNGGAGSNAVRGGGGGGGGGRIKIFYKRTIDRSGSYIVANGSYGGTGSSPGQSGYVGTVHIEPTAGSVYISSIPSGARIIIDDIDTGLNTPNTIWDLSPGYHSCKLVLTQHITLSWPFDVTAGLTEILDIPLIPLLPTKGYLYISSNPHGAKIYIDDIDLGLTTPIIMQDLSPGTHTYKLTLTGYHDVTGSFSIIAGQVTIVEAELYPLVPKGYLYISSNPPGAKIFIDDVEQIGKTTPTEIYNLSIGRHTYILSLTGYDDITGSFDIIVGQITIIEAILTLLVPVTGYLYISSIPLGAEIYIDNIDTGKVTPMIIPDLSPGNHYYKLTLPKYKDEICTFNIASDQITVIYKELLKLSVGCQQFSSTPKGADVYIDNTGAGILTPGRKCNYPIGTWLLRMDGRFETPKYGCITFDSVPKGLSIIIDGIYTGKKTPSKICNISAGIHTFSLEGTVSIKK